MDTVDEALAYDAMDHTAPTESIVAYLIAFGGNGCMIDLGIGPGQISIGVASAIPNCRIVGVDLSHQMLAIARRRIADADLADRITLHYADVKQLPYADASFDVVFSNTILHHIPDPYAMLAEAARVLRPGGILLIRDLYRPADATRLRQLVDTYAPIEQNTDHQRRLFAESLHAALTPDELRDIAADAGLADAEVIIETDRHMVLQIGKWKSGQD